MCLHCNKHVRRHLIEDRSTGLIVCEECGYAVEAITEDDYKRGQYIWKVNPAWPIFHSFEDLMHKILKSPEHSLPPCNIITGIPSLILTRAFDILHEPELKKKDRRKKLH
jgi:DNA-directed RNA polymerase subunit RPC12/RpoP